MQRRRRLTAVRERTMTISFRLARPQMALLEKEAQALSEAGGAEVSLHECARQLVLEALEQSGEKAAFEEALREHHTKLRRDLSTVLEIVLVEFGNVNREQVLKLLAQRLK